MTNPFTVMVLHAIDSYHKVMAASPSQHTLPKGLFMFSIGTAILATVIYKITKTYNNRSIFFTRFFNQFITHTQTEIPFEDKYFKEYDEWVDATATATAQDAATADTPEAEAHKKECLENMYYSTVRETINDFYGDIIMCYDAATFSFAYYARTANIPYRYLETVSRKYMIETNAPRDIHVDIRKEYAKAKEQLTNKKVSSSSSNAPSQTDNTDGGADVFAKFKSYNTAPNISNAAHTQQTTNTNTHTHQQNTQTHPNQQNTTTTTKIMRENANRYSYRGKIEDFDTHHNTFLAHRRAANATNTATNTATATTAPINETYAEYKKRIASLCSESLLRR
jgi:hypothetical protein